AGLVPSARGTLTALSIHLDADHLGRGRGSTILIGYADASAQAPARGTTTTGRSTTPSSPAHSSARAKERTKRSTQVPAGISAGARVAVRHETAPKISKRNGLPVKTTIPDVTPKLTASRYVFPVYGP